MKWDTLEYDTDVDKFLNENCEVKKLKAAEFCFDDNEVNGVTFELKDGTLLNLTSPELNQDGTRKALVVSVSNPVTKGTK